MPEIWDNDYRERVLESLRSKVKHFKCPSCDNPRVTLVNGFFQHSLNRKPSGDVSLGGPTVPTVAVACEKCGYIREYSAGVLGLMDSEESNAKKQKQKS